MNETKEHYRVYGKLKTYFSWDEADLVRKQLRAGDVLDHVHGVRYEIEYLEPLDSYAIRILRYSPATPVT